jgi:hypothetical protein
MIKQFRILEVREDKYNIEERVLSDKFWGGKIVYTDWEIMIYNITFAQALEIIDKVQK